jgi:hypothetical protein
MVLLSTIGRRKKIRQDMSFKRAFFLWVPDLETIFAVHVWMELSLLIALPGK